ncbi:MAG: hypothetical protein IJP33_02940 [Firmicutes bacterium]|nr:hypothetical protein [Bacillota bacterium]
MKKLIVVLLALSLCLGVSGAALADDAPLLIAPNPAAGGLITPPAPTLDEYYASGKIDEGQLPFASVRSVVLDAEGGMWVGTNGGGLAYKPADSEVFTEYFLTAEDYAAAADQQALLSQRFMLGSNVVQSLAVDEKGGMWISQAKTYDPRFATQNKGVAYVYEDKITFYNTIEAPGTVPNDYVQAIKIADDGRVWFGSFGGLTVFDPKTNEWKTYTTENDLPSPSVNSIEFDALGYVWFGCYPSGTGTKDDPFVGGFGWIDEETGKAFALPIEAPYSEEYQTSLLADAWVRDIAADNYGGVWIVCSGSYGNMQNKGGIVYYVDALGNGFSVEGRHLLGDKLTGNSEIRCIEVDESGTVWFGTWNGVYAFNVDRKDDRCFSAANSDWLAPAAQHTQLDNIYSLDIYGDKMYIGSNGGVVVRDVKIAEPMDKSEGIWLNVHPDGMNCFSIFNGLSIFLEVPPVVIDETTFVPVRFVTEMLGIHNNWDAAAPDKVTLTAENMKIELTLGSTEVIVNGEVQTLVAAPFAEDGRTLVPVRFISETLGYAVDFNFDTKDICIK